MKAYNQLHQMLVAVARALGNDLLKERGFKESIEDNIN